MSSLASRLKRLEQKSLSTDNYWSQFQGLSFEQFWDAIGRPEKGGVLHPIYPYEQTVYETLTKIDGSPKDKHLWVKKATGLGITEWVLRWMAWTCCKDNTMKGKEMFIVTGPRIELAKGLIKRMKGFFPSANETRDTIIEVNGCRIEAFPSHHVATMRGQNPKVIFVDEGDFFPPGQQSEVRTASERYIAKSDPYIIMVSTPNLPDGLFDKLEREPENDTIYRRLFLPYAVGVGNIYTVEDIEKAKKAPSFEREYNLKYGYGVGNVWLPQQIEAATKYPYNPNQYVPSLHFMGIDPAYGSSKFAFVVARIVDQKAQVVIAEEYERADIRKMLERGRYLIDQFKISKTYVDGANPSYITALKSMLQERTDYLDAIKEYDRAKMDYQTIMKVVPVFFSQENTEMLTHAQEMVADGMVAIAPQFESLLTQMRSARVKNTGKLDKEDGTGATYDLVDSFFLCMKGIAYRGRRT